MKSKFTTNIDKALLEKLKIEAIKEGRNVNEILEELIEEYLNKGDSEMKFENLQAVNYYNGKYELEFNLDGDLQYITVDASDHPEAATDEDYFDNHKVVEKIIAEN